MSIQANLVAVVVVAVTFAGCATTGAIQPVSKSKSEFEGAVYGGETTVINSPTPSAESYRVFNQGATGFVSLEANREDAEHRATRFCEQRKQAFRPLQETVSRPPYILGNFPRVELVFECMTKEVTAQQVPSEDKYSQLEKLKKLLDNGTLTRDEFDREKSKVLSGQ